MTYDEFTIVGTVFYRHKKVIFTLIRVIITLYKSVYCLYLTHGNDANRYRRESRAEYCA